MLAEPFEVGVERAPVVVAPRPLGDDLPVGVDEPVAGPAAVEQLEGHRIDGMDGRARHLVAQGRDGGHEFVPGRVGVGARRGDAAVGRDVPPPPDVVGVGVELERRPGHGADLGRLGVVHEPVHRGLGIRARAVAVGALGDQLRRSRR
ncbi:MAG: hypothetical protein U5J98_07215 [Halobacteriales archaeon]|nr:hypothetical protein [Halobacteriales archaeon]